MSILATKVNFKLNSFQANVPHLQFLKTSGSPYFSNVLRGYKNGTLALNCVNDTRREKLRFYLIQYKNGCLAASDLFHVYTIN